MSGTPTRKTLTVSDGTTVSYLVDGGGSPVVLLHGFAASAASWWSIGAAQRLAETHRVLAPDIRGHGDSDKPTGSASYGRRLVSDIVELLDTEGHDICDIVGFSMGSELGLAFSVRQPHRVRSLTLAGSGWSPDSIVAEYRKWFDALADRAENPHALAALIEGVPELAGLSEEAIAGLPMPLHGIIGERDDERPYMERIAEVRPGFRPHVLRGLDHLGSWRSPEFPSLLVRILADGS